LAADTSCKGTVDLTVAGHWSSAPPIVLVHPDRVIAAFADLPAAVTSKVPLEITEPHAVSVTRSGSVLAPSGKGLGSPSSR
jgi:hypothetical protein